MRRIAIVLILVLAMPYFHTSANEVPFNTYIDENVIIHPGETISFQIGWHNIVDDERHINVELLTSDPEISVEGLPLESFRVGSGRLGNYDINITADPNSLFENKTFSIKFSCDEVPEWTIESQIDVLISRWSALTFGSESGSSFYVNQDIRASLAMNLSNMAGVLDSPLISMDTESDWNYGFDLDTDNDGEFQLELIDGEDKFISFWIDIPPVMDGSPLAGTGPSFTLTAKSNIDQRIVKWEFSLEIQTWYNITVDYVGDDLILEPGKDGRIEIEIRNNGNIPTLIDAELKLGSTISDRINDNGWTVALFNAFEDQSLSPNESRVIDVGIDAPYAADGSIDVELLVKPVNYPEKMKSILLGAEINMFSDGQIVLEEENQCLSLVVMQNCTYSFSIENTGNYWNNYSLEITNISNIIIDSTIGFTTLDSGEKSNKITFHLQPPLGIEGLTPASFDLILISCEPSCFGEDRVIVDQIKFSSIIEPYVDWTFEQSEYETDNRGRINLVMTMRNDGNIDDGLIVKLSCSHFTEMSFIPPENSIYESEIDNVRSFEVIGIKQGENFTYRAWAKIPDNQNSDGEMKVEISAHSRLAEDTIFSFEASTNFTAIQQEEEKDSVMNSFGQVLSYSLGIIWAWKWIICACIVSGLFIHKGINDRRKRNLDSGPQSEKGSQPQDDWMADFYSKKEEVSPIIKSPEIPAEAYADMFRATHGEAEISVAPLDPELVGAASTVIDHHDIGANKGKIDSLVSEIESGNISKPHSANEELPDDLEYITDRTIVSNKSLDKEKSFNEDLDI